MPGGGLYTPTEFVVYSGITDADGNAAKTTLLCSAIGSASDYPDFDGNQIIITSGDYKGQARDIDGATNGDAAGTITVANAFDGKILEDTLFLIMGIRTVPAEVAALEGKVGAGYDGLDDAVENSSSVRGHLLLTNEVLARTGTFYFVGIGGNDANDGKSWTNRRLTVTSGYGLCSSGDTLIIGPGIFTEDINFNTDGVWVIGRGQGHEGTNIRGASTMTCKSNHFEDIFFFDTVGTVVKVGNDANANYNEFPNCRIGGAGSAIPLHIDGSVAGGGGFNIFDKCNIYEGSTAAVLIDGGAATGNILRECRVRPQTGVASHGIHVNHASTLRNTFIDCVVVGAGSTGTGIYFQAGTHNIAFNCHVDDITTPYNIAANNYIVGCHEDSKIATGNTTEADLAAIKTQVDLINSASGSGTLNTATANPHTATISPSSLPTKMHLIFDISNLNTNTDDFEVQVSVGAAASERVVAWYGLTSDGTDITCDTGSGVGSVIKTRRIDISNILVFTGEQVIVSLKRNAGADDTVSYKWICGV